MKIVDIATEIFFDAGSPAETSIPAIAFWIRGKIGTLNTVLFENFQFNETTKEINSANGGDLSYEAIAIIKQMYRIYDYDIQIRTQLAALAVNSIVKIEDQGTSITRVNRNTINQTLSKIRKEEIDMLAYLIKSYHSREGVPLQVAGDDTQVGYTQQFPSSYAIYPRR
jgi:hypothetical protein